MEKVHLRSQTKSFSLQTLKLRNGSLIIKVNIIIIQLKKLNEVTVRYGTETVIKAIHNALDGVNIDINRSYIKQIE